MRTLRSCFQCEVELAALELGADELGAPELAADELAALELAAVELAAEELLPDELALDELPPQLASASAAPRTARAGRIGGLCMRSRRRYQLRSSFGTLSNSRGTSCRDIVSAS